MTVEAVSALLDATPLNAKRAQALKAIMAANGRTIVPTAVRCDAPWNRTQQVAAVANRHHRPPHPLTSAPIWVAPAPPEASLRAARTTRAERAPVVVLMAAPSRARRCDTTSTSTRSSSNRWLLASQLLGPPCVRPIWVLWEGQAFWWLTGSWSALEQHLASDPTVAIVIDICDLDSREVKLVRARGAAELHPSDRERAYASCRATWALTSDAGIPTVSGCKPTPRSAS